jgi:uncharacterized NAD-dependent epimerase/dehydratase family protein
MADSNNIKKSDSKGEDKKERFKGGSYKKKPQKKKKGRCAYKECKKKVTMYGFDCRCGKRFCSTHLPSDLHSCTFDYRKAGQEQLADKNKTVVADKFTKI